MKVIILCGGIGSRMEDYSYPKPLNMIYGKPSICYTLNNLPDTIKNIHFVVAPHLVKYNFEEHIKNEFKTIQCIFHYLPYFTRGAIESALLGTKDLEDSNENIVFLDNDVLYDFPIGLFEDKDTPFIGYSIDTTNNTKYSYIKLNNDGYLTDFKEKIKISDFFCCGVYGFKSIKQFREIAIKRINSIGDSELYMSLLFQDMINNHIKIKGVSFNGEIYHIGSLKELKHSWNVIKKPKMRICFDLDNTLVTYPSIPGDYTTVKPINTMINLAKKMHNEGHIIIIHTARRMKTHNHNVGAVIKDIGKITFDTLEKFNIPYDEIIFGKPIADMYIDDRAINPYRNDLFSLGYIYDTDIEHPLNSLKTNKYNTVQLYNNKVIKNGPIEFLSGEIFFYKNIPNTQYLRQYFPIYYDSYIETNTGIIELEHIEGIPMFTLYKTGLISIEHINKCLEFLNILHSYKGNSLKINKQLVINNYILKLKERFSISTNYPFDDVNRIQSECLSKLNTYINKDNIQIVDYIHGDFWFSNIIFDFKGKLKTFDMKGKVYNICYTGGDILYDYAKMYQSILGYDCILNNVPMPINYDQLRSYYEDTLIKNNTCINLDDLKTVTFSLVIGTFHSIESLETKVRLWEWIKTVFCPV